LPKGTQNGEACGEDVFRLVGRRFPPKYRDT
jgi:hypothetical protein